MIYAQANCPKCSRRSLKFNIAKRARFVFQFIACIIQYGMNSNELRIQTSYNLTVINLLPYLYCAKNNEMCLISSLKITATIG